MAEHLIIKGETLRLEKYRAAPQKVDTERWKTDGK